MPYGYRYGYAIDPTYILVLIGALISMFASMRVKSTFHKYAKVRSRTNMTGAQAAQRVLNSAGIYDVTIRHVAGELTDHYDPRNKTLNLSDSVYGSTSVAAVGVAAHECGHAIQHANAYLPLKFRTAIVPAANIGAKVAWPLILIGMILGSSSSRFLITLGIIMFSLSVLFQFVTLPVEINASRRAVNALSQMGILYGEEVNGTKKVLSAAALTYVAAAASAALQLLRLILLFGRRND